LRKTRAIITNDFAELLALPFKKDDFSLKELLEPAFHLALLRSKGHQKDIDYCLNISILKTIPIWESDGFTSLDKS